MKDRKEYYIKNRLRILNKSKEWAKNNTEKRKGQIKRYRKKYPEKDIKLQIKYQKNRYKIDLKYNLNKKISRLIKLSLKGNKNGYHWEVLVGYILNDLIKQLKKTMPEGYNWQDYLNGDLHIDHIIPISVFNFDCPENTDFKRCWSLKNLRLLPAKENLLKSNKLEKPFQPALQI